MSTSAHHSGLALSSTGSSISGIDSSLWILDSGASHHMSPHVSNFISLSPVSPISVLSASDTKMSVEGVGPIVTSHISLSDVYYVPTLALNLVSVSQLCKSGYWVFFSDSICAIQDQHTRRMIGTGRKKGELYVLEKLEGTNVDVYGINSEKTNIGDIAASGVDLSSFRLSHLSSEFYLWHSRLGHISASRLKFLVSTGALGQLNTCDISDCSGCKLAKIFAFPI